MKRICWAALAVVGIMLVGGCTSEIDEKVAFYNEQTESTITMYTDVKSIVDGHEEELIQGIASGDLSAFPCSDDLDFSEITKELTGNVNEFIEEAPFITLSNLFTRLGRNSVLQTMKFYYSGTQYFLEIVWSDCEIAGMNLEVSANG